MHILVISQQWLPEKGIAQQRLNDLTQTMRQHGHTVSIVTSPPHFPNGKLLSTLPQHQSKAYEKNEDGLDIYRTRFREHNESIASRIIDQAVELLSSFPTSAHSIKNNSPDLIFASSPPLPSIITASLLGQYYKIPYVVDLRDAWPDLIPFISQAEPTKPSVPRRILPYALTPAGFLLSQALANSDGLVTSTHKQAEEFNARWAIPTHVLRNLPTSLDLFASLPPYSPHSETLNVVYNGTLGRAQGLHNILEAVSILQERSIPIRVTLRGRGAHAPYLAREARTRQLPVDVLPPVPYQDSIKSYAHADTTLVSLHNWTPLTWTVPSKLYELLASGRHITMCANGESADILREASAGDVVPPMNPEALADLWEHLHNNRECLNVGNHGIQWLKQQPSRKEEMRKTVHFFEDTVRD